MPSSLISNQSPANYEDTKTYRRQMCNPICIIIRQRIIELREMCANYTFHLIRLINETSFWCRCIVAPICGSRSVKFNYFCAKIFFRQFLAQKRRDVALVFFYGRVKHSNELHCSCITASRETLLAFHVNWVCGAVGRQCQQEKFAQTRLRLCLL